MIYRFRSRNDADVVMTQPVAERVLQVMGKDPAREGIVLVEQIPAALDALRAAAQADEAARASGRDDDAAETADDAREGAAGAKDPVSFRRRVWPLVQMLERAQAGDDPVTWQA